MTGPPLSLAEVESLARAVLPGPVWDFIAGGSGDELAMAGNRAAFDSLRLVPRVLAGHRTACPATTLLGGPAAMPVAIAPMAYQRLLHPDGELATARAAHAAGVPFVVSTLSSVSVADIAATGATIWFQLYWIHDRAYVSELVRRATEVGATAMLLTVDVPVMGRRLRDRRHGFALPDGVTAANLPDRLSPAAHGGDTGDSAVSAHTRDVFCPSVGWDDIEWLRTLTELPLVLKGVLDVADAVRAADAGIDGVVVSNHGGRQLTAAVPSVRALPAVVDAVGDRCEILLDSGVRSGTDVLRALALGAGGVLLGRPVLYGLGRAGATGVTEVLELLRAELGTEMLLAGAGDVAAARRLATTWLNG